MTPVNAKNLVKHEMIGLRVRVADSRNKQIKGKTGTAIDETRNTLTLMSGSRKKTIPKDVALFRVYLPDGSSVLVDGKRLMGRPEERIRKRVQKW